MVLGSLCGHSCSLASQNFSVVPELFRMPTLLRVSMKSRQHILWRLRVQQFRAQVFEVPGLGFSLSPLAGMGSICCTETSLQRKTSRQGELQASVIEP